MGLGTQRAGQGPTPGAVVTHDAHGDFEVGVGHPREAMLAICAKLELVVGGLACELAHEPVAICLLTAEQGEHVAVRRILLDKAFVQEKLCVRLAGVSHGSKQVVGPGNGALGHFVAIGLQDPRRNAAVTCCLLPRRECLHKEGFVGVGRFEVAQPVPLAVVRTLVVLLDCQAGQALSRAGSFGKPGREHRVFARMGKPTRILFGFVPARPAPCVA